MNAYGSNTKGPNAKVPGWTRQRAPIPRFPKGPYTKGQDSKGIKGGRLRVKDKGI